MERTGLTLSVELAPGLLTSIYDGIQRPLELIEKQSKSPYIARGIEVPSLDRSKKWEFKAVAKKGETVQPGQILGTVQETTLIEHRVMVPPGVAGKLEDIKKGDSVQPGQILGTVQETTLIEHRIMGAPGVSGMVP